MNFHHFQDTPSRIERPHNSSLSSSNYIHLQQLLSKVLQLSVEIGSKRQLSIEQRNSICNLLEVLQKLVESLITSNQRVIDPTIPSKIEDLLHSISTLANNYSPSRYRRYGIFQDRITNLSPSISYKSIYDLKEEIARDEEEQKFHDDIDDEGDGMNHNHLEDDDSEFEDEKNSPPSIRHLPHINDLAYTPTRPAFNLTSNSIRQNRSIEFLDFSRRNLNRTKLLIRPSMNR